MIDPIDFDDDEINAAGAWHGGLGSMLYAVTSTGRLSLGTHRPRNSDGEPMSDEEWFTYLACNLEHEADSCITMAKRMMKGTRGERRKELQREIAALTSISAKAKERI